MNDRQAKTVTKLTWACIHNSNKTVKTVKLDSAATDIVVSANRTKSSMTLETA